MSRKVRGQIIELIKRNKLIKHRIGSTGIVARINKNSNKFSNIGFIQT